MPKIYLQIVALVLLVALYFPSFISAHEGDFSGFAWSSNIGWISLSSQNCDSNGDGLSDGGENCPDNGTAIASYAVKKNGENISGYAWSSNIGWISFNEDDLAGCPDGLCKAYVSSEKIKGWARACAGEEFGDCSSSRKRVDGWDGWIKLSGISKDGANYGVLIEDDGLKGFSWGSDVIGWIKFGSDIGDCVDCGGGGGGGGGGTPFSYSVMSPSFSLEAGKIQTKSVEVELLSGTSEEVLVTVETRTLPTVLKSARMLENRCVPKNKCLLSLSVESKPDAVKGQYSFKLISKNKEVIREHVVQVSIIEAPVLGLLQCAAYIGDSKVAAVKTNEKVTWKVSGTVASAGLGWFGDNINGSGGAVTVVYKDKGVKSAFIKKQDGEIINCGSINVIFAPLFREF